MKKLPRILSILLLVVALAAVAVVPVSASTPTSVLMIARDSAGNLAQGVTFYMVVDNAPWPTVGTCTTGANGQCTLNFDRYAGDSFWFMSYKAGLGTLYSNVYDFSGSAPYYGWAYYHQSYASLGNRPPRN